MVAISGILLSPTRLNIIYRAVYLSGMPFDALDCWAGRIKGFLYICLIKLNNPMDNQQTIDLITYSAVVLSMIAVIFMIVTYFYVKRDLNRRFQEEKDRIKNSKSTS